MQRVGLHRDGHLRWLFMSKSITKQVVKVI